MTVAPITEPIIPPGPDAPAECDIIMKGGITSGVVYPLAIVELSKSYRFKSIGGTSAGAIAAGLTAAAEFARGEPGAGFDRLEKLPRELGTRLLSLFQPSPETRPAFEVLLSVLKKGSTAAKLAGAMGKILRFQGLAALVGALLSAGLWFLLIMLPLGADRGRPGTWILWGLAALAGGVIGAVVRFLLGSWRSLNQNGFGLCNGLDRVPGSEQPLTPWLAEELNRTAGSRLQGRLLTFGDLWGGGPEDRAAQETDPALRKVNLEVMTTSLTHGSPRRIPFSTRDLFFDPKQLRKYFPDDVVGWMEKHPRKSRKAGGLTDRIAQQTRFRPLPEPWDLPVVVAVRMSLSFPGLISAVPLYGVDWDRPDNQQADAEGRAPKLDLCWFSDGGIGSNFPVHFFDGLIPSRPTFGINLRPFSEAHKQDFHNEEANVEFPSTSGEEVLPTWTPIKNIYRFFRTILDTMQNWVDNTQMRQPGYRDRVIHVLLSKQEGGMNLTMSKRRIDKLSLRGQAAGRQLAGFDWNQHRWTRYRTTMSQLQLRMQGMDKVYRHGFRDFLQAFDSTRKGTFYSRSGKWKTRAIQETDRLMDLAKAWSEDPSGPRFADDAPRPEPELRIGPKR
jgi:predicted acylesterase/phospholipase RssA